jgi:hypothetical protein
MTDADIFADHVRCEIGQLRAVIQRELDMRLDEAARQRALALAALKNLDRAQFITWLLSAGAAAVAIYAAATQRSLPPRTRPAHYYRPALSDPLFDDSR